MRFFLAFFVSMAVYHWALDELHLMSPQASEFTRGLVEKLRIPTHDRWPANELVLFVSGETEFSEFIEESWITLKGRQESI